MSKFKKYLEIVSENHIYNESDYDLIQFPGVLKTTTPEMLTNELESLKRVLETNIDTKDNVGDIEVIRQIIRTLTTLRNDMDTQYALIKNIRDLASKYEDHYDRVY
jgi:hypothetical protein